jgi:hypothetical protein
MGTSLKAWKTNFKPSLLLAGLLALSSSALAEGEKRLIYCDHPSNSKNVYIDIYLSYEPKENVYTDPEVGVFDSSDSTVAYPSYLWPLSVTYDPSTNQSQLYLDRGKDNNIKFTVPAMADGIVLETDISGAIDPFNLTAKGIYKGFVLNNALFSCYSVFATPTPTVVF